MSDPKSNAARQYFIAVGDKQVGPLSEGEVILKIKTGEISKETLIWFDGMGEWSLIVTRSEFQGFFKAKPIVEEKPKSAPTEISQNSKPKFLGDEKSVSTAFDESQARLGDTYFVSDRISRMLGGFIILILLVTGYFFYESYVVKGQLSKSKGNTGVSAFELRETQYRKAASSLLIDSKNSEKTLLELVKTNPVDIVAKEAVKTLLEFYSQNQRYSDAGNLLLSIHLYKEASDFYKKDGNRKREAEQAIYKAYETAKLPEEKRKYLEESINLLMLANSPLEKVIDRIKIMEKEFPGFPHPFAYYLKPVDDRISDIFTRISFHFVESLLAYMDGEFPQINLMDRPLVEVRKDREGLYKIVGTYKGEILLNKDKLEAIQFVFWMNENKWVLVDTNLTKERKKWAEQERKKLQTIGVSGEKMLQALETTFKNKFPSSAPHERNLASPSKESKNTSDF